MFAVLVAVSYEKGHACKEGYRRKVRFARTKSKREVNIYIIKKKRQGKEWMIKSEFFPFFLEYTKKRERKYKRKAEKDRKKQEFYLKKLFAILLQNTILDLVV